MFGNEKFEERDIPYSILDRFGITRDMVEDWPASVKEQFLSSQPTPVMPIEVDDGRGGKIRAKAKLALIKKLRENGMPYMDVLFVMRWDDLHLDEYSPDTRARLERGEVVLDKDPYGAAHYLQVAESVNQVVSVPVDVMHLNLGRFYDSLGADSNEYRQLCEGKPVEMKDYYGNTFTMGIDLTDSKGIRIANGDKEAWKAAVRAENLPEYSFGLYGCWVSDGHGAINYVPEDKYTVEMMAEQRRYGTQNAVRAHIDGLQSENQPQQRGL